MSIQVLDFYADWCGPCKTQGPIFEEVKEEFEDNSTVTFEKVDVEEDQDRANRYNVKSIPVIIIIEKDEDDEITLLERFVGVTEKNALEEAIREHLD